VPGEERLPGLANQLRVAIAAVVGHEHLIGG
jgi:hypothetical protein